MCLPQTVFLGFVPALCQWAITCFTHNALNRFTSSSQSPNCHSCHFYEQAISILPPVAPLGTSRQNTLLFLSLLLSLSAAGHCSKSICNSLPDLSPVTCSDFAPDIDESPSRRHYLLETPIWKPLLKMMTLLAWPGRSRMSVQDLRPVPQS